MGFRGMARMLLAKFEDQRVCSAPVWGSAEPTEKASCQIEYRSGSIDSKVRHGTDWSPMKAICQKIANHDVGLLIAMIVAHVFSVTACLLRGSISPIIDNMAPNASVAVVC